MKWCKKTLSMFKFLNIAMILTIALTGCVGKQGERGPQGVAGKDGHTPIITINAEGYWVIDGEVTTFKAIGTDGESGTNGKDGYTPIMSINAEGYWVIDGKVTAVKAIGTDGEPGTDGKDGYTPIITINAEGYWVIDGEVTTFKAIGKDGKDGEIVYIEQTTKYTIGQEVKFNPGDGEKTWNVIDEDETTVTLMLTENLGNTVAWYKYSNHNSYDNSYGPKDALDYLNSLTTKWYNVGPIKSYSYVNNLNNLNGPTYGYQKIEIKNGNTILTHKDGTTITEVAGVTKARILSLEEILEIALKVNLNLTEGNLRAFLERNLPTANTMLGTNLTTVEDAIALVMQSNEWLRYESKYMQTYYTVLTFINDYGLEPTYDISLPNYLYQNLNSNNPTGYWLLSAIARYSSLAWYVAYDGCVYNSGVHTDFSFGVRPVITISKALPLEIIE